MNSGFVKSAGVELLEDAASSSVKENISSELPECSILRAMCEELLDKGRPREKKARRVSAICVVIAI